MGTTKNMASVAGVVVCLAAGVAVYGYREGSAARAENAAALEENRVLAQEIRLAAIQLEEAERRKRQADEACAAARKRAEELSAMKVASAVAKPDAKAKVMDARQVRMQLMLTNSEYQSAVVEMQRLEVSSSNFAHDAARSTTNQLVQDLFYSSTPLTVAQAASVTSLLSKNSQSSKSGTSLIQNFDWEAIFAQAPGVLTEAQVAVLKQRVDAIRLHRALCDFMAKAAAVTP